jgi:hypothetical protein
MALYYPNFVKYGDNVQFGIIFSAKYLVQNFSNQRQGISVFDRHAVQSSIVVTYAYSFPQFFGQ